MSGARGALVVRAVRRVPALRRFAGAVVDRMVLAADVPPPGLRAGLGVPARVSDRGVPALLVLLDPQEGALEATVADLGRLALVLPGVRPLLVTDGTTFSVVRRAGFAVDHVLSRREWAERYPDRSWREYFAERMAQLRTTYGADRVVALPSGGTADLDLDVLAEALRPRRPGRIRALSRRLVTGVVRRVDPPAAAG